VPPLSEREQQILEEIERSLYDEDPGFARHVRKASPTTRELRNGKFGVVLFLVGLVTLIAFFVTSSLIVGVIAFAGMVAGIVVILGAATSLVGSHRRSSRRPNPKERITSALRSWEDKVRKRYKH
jgi:hypothetical protein